MHLTNKFFGGGLRSSCIALNLCLVKGENAAFVVCCLERRVSQSHNNSNHSPLFILVIFIFSSVNSCSAWALSRTAETNKMTWKINKLLFLNANKGADHMDVFSKPWPALWIRNLYGHKHTWLSSFFFKESITNVKKNMGRKWWIRIRIRIEWICHCGLFNYINHFSI